MSKNLWGILLIVVVILVGANYKSIIKFFYPIQYENEVNKYAVEYNLNPCMVYSLIKVESKFDPYAKSNRGAMGLMQITPQTGKYLSQLIGDSGYQEAQLFNPDINIKYGCFYFSKLINDFDGNLNCALAAYNGGEGNVRKWLRENGDKNKVLNLEDIPFSETRLYVKRVTKYFGVYKFLYSK